MQHAPIQLPRRIRRRLRRRTDPGAVPGTIIPHPKASQSKASIIEYTKYACNSRTISTVDVKRLADVNLDANTVRWIDVKGLGSVDLIHQLGESFGLHPLALEDVVNMHQRSKFEMYGDHIFVIARAHMPGTIDSEQIALFLGRNFVITLQEDNVDCLEPVKKRIETAKGQIRARGADYLLYALIDVIVDGYFPALEEYGERLDALDDRISVKDERNLIDQIHNVRSELLAIRRAVWPLRETINSLIRDSGELIHGETDLYLRDCYDHTVQIIDVIETDRELCADLRDYYLTVASNRMNQIMKFLTIIATLFIPLSFIASVYGMNFNPQASNWNMPELNWTMGYPFALGLMTSIACGLIYFFWRRGWLS